MKKKSFDRNLAKLETERKLMSQICQLRAKLEEVDEIVNYFNENPPDNAPEEIVVYLNDLVKELEEIGMPSADDSYWKITDRISSMSFLPREYTSEAVVKMAGLAISGARTLLVPLVRYVVSQATFQSCF